MARHLTLAMLGDVMLGRYVNDAFTMNKEEQRAIWGDLPQALGRLDPRHTLVAGNLECCITNSSQKVPKVFNFKLSPSNVGALSTLGFRFVSLANNHALDYKGALPETVRALDAAGIAHAGVGSPEEAAHPAIVDQAGMRVAFLSYSDHPEEWAASSSTPGINYIDPESFDPWRVQAQVAAARATHADLVAVFIHWGPNWRWEPAPELRRLGHAFIDAGADLVFGHSAHHLQGVEFYQGCPIIYGAGGAVDDYALDEDYRNDLGGVWVAVMGAQGECSGGTSLVEEGPTTPPQPPGVLRLGGAATSAAGASSAASAGGNARTPAAGGGGRAARLASLQLLPTRITHLWRAGESLPEGCGLPPYVARVNVARGSDHIWVAQTMRRLCRRLGTQVEDLGEGAGLRFGVPAA